MGQDLVPDSDGALDPHEATAVVEQGSSRLGLNVDAWPATISRTPCAVIGVLACAHARHAYAPLAQEPGTQDLNVHRVVQLQRIISELMLGGSYHPSILCNTHSGRLSW